MPNTNSYNMPPTKQVLFIFISSFVDFINFPRVMKNVYFLKKKNKFTIVSIFLLKFYSYFIYR